MPEPLRVVHKTDGVIFVYRDEPEAEKAFDQLLNRLNKNPGEGIYICCYGNYMNAVYVESIAMKVPTAGIPSSLWKGGSMTQWIKLDKGGHYV